MRSFIHKLILKTFGYKAAKWYRLNAKNVIKNFWLEMTGALIISALVIVIIVNIINGNVVFTSQNWYF